jgi:hypothetical protein
MSERTLASSNHTGNVIDASSLTSIENVEKTDVEEEEEEYLLEQQMSLPITPPIRYGIVCPTLYRGGYPTLRNFRFLR